MKVDRSTKNHQLQIDDGNGKVYTRRELLDFYRQEQLIRNQIEPTVAFGLVGFVRFLEGYYVILITKRRCVAMIGHHCVYKIEDTLNLYLPNERAQGGSGGDEHKYLRIFNNVDLKSNFYFSYTYDLSNTLQYNMSPSYQASSVIGDFKCGFGRSDTYWNVSSKFLAGAQAQDGSANRTSKYMLIKPNLKHVWNEHLLGPMTAARVHSDFFLHIIHGFVSQAQLPLSARNLFITLIARRCKIYAGTRYLKRGTNCDGYTANEVETEQIVHDANVSSLMANGLFTSFVQLRGSVPVYWSQNIAKMVPKPPINIDHNDPFYKAAGKHFNQLLYSYGSPILVFNLVKRKEKRPQESILHKELEGCIEYLNQFIPQPHQLSSMCFDMARSSKQKEDVMGKLGEIARHSLKKTGIFISRPIASSLNSSWFKRMMVRNGMVNKQGPLMQTGITRVNCVDCLDRTNTAQFSLGWIALGYQLHSLGALRKAEMNFDSTASDLMRLLEELYEDHGDTLALQYGGSQLVHRIKTYRKIAPITSQSKDIMQSLSRYYSNAFSDWDKQTAINLFLGLYGHLDARTPIWMFQSDYQLHHKFIRWSTCKPDEGFNVGDNGSIQQYTKWWSDEVAICLPRAAKEFFKNVRSTGVECCNLKLVKKVPVQDWFYSLHRCYENSSLEETYLFNIKRTKQHLADSDLRKRLAVLRTNNRRSLVGIPLNTSSSSAADDSDADDQGSEDDQKIILKFDNSIADFESVKYVHCLLSSTNKRVFLQR